MAGDKDSKTEQPTPKRLQDARRKGQVAKSQDLTSAVSFAVFAVILAALLTYLFQYTYRFLQRMLSFSFDSVQAFENNLNHFGMQAVIWFILLVAPFAVIALIAGIVGNLVQVGFLFTPDPLKPSFKKINPANGFKNIFGKKAVFGLVQNLVKLAVVIWIMGALLWGSIGHIMNSTQYGSAQLFPMMRDLMGSLAFRLGIFMVVLGVGNYVFQRYSHKKELRMSQKEIKDEHKEMEGDPMIKSQRRARYQEMLSGKISDVDDATLVLTNPTHYAVAIRFDREQDDVPIVVAKGADAMATKVKDRARANDIQIFENKPLARAIYNDVKVGEPIPVDMYESIAELLALVYEAEAKKKRKI